MALQALKTVLVFGLVILFSSCEPKQKALLPYYNTPNFMPIWQGQDVFTKDTLHQVGDFNLTNQKGNLVSLDSVKGKIHIANFFFTSCSGICPKMTNNLQEVAKGFSDSKNMLFLSFSVTPEQDSVSVLKNYAQDFNITQPNWHLLTGSKNDIYELARKSYFAEEEPGFNRDSSEFLHTEHVLLVDENLHLRGIYNGTLRLEMQRLKEDINILLKK